MAPLMLNIPIPASNGRKLALAPPLPRHDSPCVVASAAQVFRAAGRVAGRGIGVVLRFAGGVSELSCHSPAICVAAERITVHKDMAFLEF